MALPFKGVRLDPQGCVVACPGCQHIACVCEIRRAHEVACKYRIAAAGAVPIECDHGRDVCPLCDPCTCSAL